MGVLLGDKAATWPAGVLCKDRATTWPAGVIFEDKAATWLAGVIFEDLVGSGVGTVVGDLKKHIGDVLSNCIIVLLLTRSSNKFRNYRSKLIFDKLEHVLQDLQVN